MSKRKVHFDESEAVPGPGEEDGNSSSKDKSTRFKEKHSLDSDEEDIPDSEKYDVMNEDDIEGQEDATLEFDEGTKITPFNMEEELEEGHFDADGTYIFNKEKEIHDSWMDNIDWVKVKAQEEKLTKEAPGIALENDDSDDEEQDDCDEISIFKEMIELMKSGETVAKALRRLGGGTAGMASASQRWKTKKQKTSDNSKNAANTGNKELMLKLTGLADRLVQNGRMDIYQETYEKLAFLVKQKEAEKVKPQQPKMDDEAAFDMFASDMNMKQEEQQETKKDSSEKATVAEEKSSAAAPVSEVCWHYKWNMEDSEVHGPFSSSEMLEWQENDFFKDGVFVRKVGQEGSFYSSKRIDFDLYT